MSNESSVPSGAAAPPTDGLDALEQRQAGVPWEALHRYCEALERWHSHGSAFAKPLKEAIEEVGRLWASREGGSSPDDRLVKALEPFARMGENPNLLPNGTECDLRCGVPSPRELRQAATALREHRVCSAALQQEERTPSTDRSTR